MLWASNQTTLRTLFKIFTILALFGLTACGGEFQTSQLLKSASIDTEGDNTKKDDVTPTPTPLPKSVLGTVSSLSDVNLDLGEEITQTVTITADSSFSGQVDPSVDRSGLQSINGQNDVEITLTPSSVTLASGQSVDVDVKVKTLLSAPSFNLSAVKIVASAADQSALDAESNLNIQVNGVVTMRMFGGAVPADRWDRPATINFRPHSPELLIRFVNMDTADTHIVHGNGSIPHQNTGMPSAAAANDGEEGGVYEVRISETETNDGSYYYHDIENGTFRRFMNFNRANPAAATSLSVATHEKLSSMTMATEPVDDVQTCADILGSDDI